MFLKLFQSVFHLGEHLLNASPLINVQYIFLKHTDWEKDVIELLTYKKYKQSPSTRSIIASLMMGE